MKLDFTTVLPYIPYLLEGAWLTVEISFLAIVVSLIFGLCTALMKISHYRTLKAIANTYIGFIRGTPLLVQMFLVYFALPQVGIEIDAFTSSVIALGLNGGAYIAEIFRASILSIPYGQTEAARSLGMNYLLSMRKIILPQAFRFSLPPLGNQFIITVKDSSLCSVITVGEIMHLSGRFASVNFAYLEFYVVAAMLYFVITFAVSRIISMLEKKFSAGDRRSSS